MEYKLEYSKINLFRLTPEEWILALKQSLYHCPLPKGDHHQIPDGIHFVCNIQDDLYELEQLKLTIKVVWEQIGELRAGFTHAYAHAIISLLYKLIRVFKHKIPETNKREIAYPFWSIWHRYIDQFLIQYEPFMRLFGYDPERPDLDRLNRFTAREKKLFFRAHFPELDKKIAGLFQLSTADYSMLYREILIEYNQQIVRIPISNTNSGVTTE